MTHKVINKISREEWIDRFCDKIRSVAKVSNEVALAELESWPENEVEWRISEPETAALESLSNWADDGE